MAGIGVPPRGHKRQQAFDESTASTFSVQTATTSGSVSTSQSLGSPTVTIVGEQPKRCRTVQGDSLAQHHQQLLLGPQFPVLDYHLQQCHQQGTFLNNATTLQPADSSNWREWPIQLQQEDTQMADSSSPHQLMRSNSAPELVKLTQADSGAWQQAHAATGSGSGHHQQTLMSHKDFWLT